MNAIYILKEYGTFLRKSLVDMPFLTEHNQIRIQKNQLEEGAYILYFPDKEKRQIPLKFLLSKDNLKKEDFIFFYFQFPFKREQFEFADRT